MHVADWAGEFQRVPLRLQMTRKMLQLANTALLPPWPFPASLVCEALQCVCIYLYIYTHTFTKSHNDRLRKRQEDPSAFFSLSFTPKLLSQQASPMNLCSRGFALGGCDPAAWSAQPDLWPIHPWSLQGQVRSKQIPPLDSLGAVWHRTLTS